MKTIVIENQLAELSKYAFVAIATTFPWQQKFCESSFANCIRKPNPIFRAFIIPELFTIMLSKCRHYTPEPRFQTRNGEIWIRAI